uniref:Uncharacterized protein n=1 Tax=Toxoplasma gondii TgCATBr9 TaxID=943120 RepID=A0A2T6J221_TOXGO|nr:hypothetical protein TGBR9_358900 [Toxoplasma gondii TgCATBr9]
MAQRVALGVSPSNTRGTSAHCNLTLCALLGPPSSSPTLLPSSTSSVLSSSSSSSLACSSASSSVCPSTSTSPPSCLPSPNSPPVSSSSSSPRSPPSSLRWSGEKGEGREGEENEKRGSGSALPRSKDEAGAGQAVREQRGETRAVDLLEKAQKQKQDQTAGSSSPPLKLLSLARCAALSSLAPLINVASTLVRVPL